jgi:hypothetical protein
MNEFFRCPSYTYGILIISSIFTVIFYIYINSNESSDATKPDLSNMVSEMGIIGIFFTLLGLGWMLWTTWNWIFRHPDCERVGNFKGNFRNPLANMFA